MAFQGNAFQGNTFQIGGDTQAPAGTVPFLPQAFRRVDEPEWRPVYRYTTLTPILIQPVIDNSRWQRRAPDEWRAPQPNIRLTALLSQPVIRPAEFRRQPETEERRFIQPTNNFALLATPVIRNEFRRPIDSEERRPAQVQYNLALLQVAPDTPVISNEFRRLKEEEERRPQRDLYNLALLQSVAPVQDPLHVKYFFRVRDDFDVYRQFPNTFNILLQPAVVTPPSDDAGAGGRIVGGTYSRKRWRELKEAEKRQLQDARIAAEHASAKAAQDIASRQAKALADTRKRWLNEDEQAASLQHAAALEMAGQALRAAQAIAQNTAQPSGLSHALALAKAKHEQDDEEEAIALLMLHHE